ncbi:SCO2400 family protein [Streptomyces lasalocidi]
MVCPGCGAYAPDIAPPGTDGHSGAYAPGTASPHIPSTAPAPAPALDDTAWYDGVPAAGPAEYGAEATAGAADVTDAPRAPQGRAARRRQLARWKKSQRRAVVATAVALVGGGLAFSSMDRGSGDRAQAATAPDNRSMGLGEERPASPTPPAVLDTAPVRPTPRGTHHLRRIHRVHGPGPGRVQLRTPAAVPHLRAPHGAIGDPPGQRPHDAPPDGHIGPEHRNLHQLLDGNGQFNVFDADPAPHHEHGPEHPFELLGLLGLLLVLFVLQPALPGRDLPGRILTPSRPSRRLGYAARPTTGEERPC